MYTDVINIADTITIMQQVKEVLPGVVSLAESWNKWLIVGFILLAIIPWLSLFGFEYFRVGGLFIIHVSCFLLIWALNAASCFFDYILNGRPHTFSDIIWGAVLCYFAVPIILILIWLWGMIKSSGSGTEGSGSGIGGKRWSPTGFTSPNQVTYRSDTGETKITNIPTAGIGKTDASINGNFVDVHDSGTGRHDVFDHTGNLVHSWFDWFKK